MTSVPLVSVLTPSFNQHRWLPETVASVRAQSYGRIEHVVMDGGSSDGTVEYLEGQADVRFESSPDRGQSHALNKAFAASSGEIIGWLNSDDAYFDATAVARAVDVFQRRPDVGVVYGHAALVGAEGEILQMMWVPRFDVRLLRRINFIVQPAAFVRRSAVSSVLADERFDYAMDRELWLRLAPGSRFARVDHVLAIDRHHSERKAYTRLDLLAEDRSRLTAMYGIPPLRSRTPAFDRAFKVAQRMLGLRLVAQARAATVFASSLDSTLSLAVRQAAVRRRSMSVREVSA
jgi:glycosyltransferase involved in cell wall biosynthesis